MREEGGGRDCGAVDVCMGGWVNGLMSKNSFELLILV